MFERVALLIQERSTRQTVGLNRSKAKPTPVGCGQRGPTAFARTQIPVRVPIALWETGTSAQATPTD
jgi:hypothetical protein